MRYLPLDKEDREAMLSVIGVTHIDELFADVPAGVLNPELGLPDHAGEFEVERHMGALAAKNRTAGSGPFFVGAGAYRHHVPATVDHIIQRSEFLTSYTPYQPEIAQGTLQYLFEFQTQVAALTGMEVANASMYDGSTACAEAALMARRVARRDGIVMSGGLHPHYASVTRMNAELVGGKCVFSEATAEGADNVESLIGEDTACVIVQNPDVFGHVRDYSALAEKVHAAGALLVIAFTEAVSLGALKSPGEMGADIVVGEGQSIGNALNFGGPYVGLFATRSKFIRNMPGRLCGETQDADGKRGYVLTLSTREQHIRRDKATSNICTNSGLCALAFSIHMTLLGETGLRHMAALSHEAACATADALAAVPGVDLMNESFFNEFTLRLPKDAGEVTEALAAKGILAGVPGTRLWPEDEGKHDLLVVAATELTQEKDIHAFASALKEVLE